MVQDAIIHNLLAASIAFLIFFLFQRALLRSLLRGAGKSPADLPGGNAAFNGYLLLQAGLYALTLAAVMTPFTLHGTDWGKRQLWGDTAMVFGVGVPLTIAANYAARWMWPSFKSIDAMLAELRKSKRKGVK